MAIRNKFSQRALFAGSLLWTTAAGAYELQMNTAKMQAMDKVTGRVSVIEAPVNSEVRFGSFSIVVRACKATPPEETPENYAFVDVADTNKDGKLYNIFKGWMISSSPALNAIEHPIYDVWLLQCINKQTNKKQMSAAELNERDSLPKKENDEQGGNLSKEALIAAEAEAEAKVAAEEEKASLETADIQPVVPETIEEPEIKEIPAPAAAVENVEEKPAEDGAPVSLIPVVGDVPAAEPATVQATETVDDVSQIENKAEETSPEAEVVLEAVTIDEAVDEAGEKETASPVPSPLLTEEDILPTVEVSDEKADDDNQEAEPEASPEPNEAAEAD